MTIAGAFLFLLKDTHGLPIDMALDRIIERGHSVEWPSFIEAARENGWPDFRTFGALEHGIQDAFISANTKDAILCGTKRYMMATQ
jgi:hypothetical protein